MSEDATQTVHQSIAAGAIAASYRINADEIIARQEAMNDLNFFSRRNLKIGAWDNSFKHYETMQDGWHRPDGIPNTVKSLVEQFKEMPEVQLTRTHGRTTPMERVQMAVYAKAISPRYIARKFNVSLPTVYLYARKYAGLI